jgi:hypothetical protein
MDELTFLQVVEAMCRHPRVYTPQGTFSEVMIFLEGFACGAEVGVPRQRNSHSKLSGPFFKWLEEYQNRPEGFVRGVSFTSFYPDNETALKEFARLYREYAEEVCRKDSLPV